jgi:hypothetical protein
MDPLQAVIPAVPAIPRKTIFMADLTYDVQQKATNDAYEAALRKGRWRSVKSWALRRCNDLLPTRRLLSRLENQTPQHVGVAMIPIDRVVGSAGRSLDFDLSFAPRNQATRERWQRVAKAIQDGIHLAPIRVLKVGDAYFVEDGNHRVSVSSMAGRDAILADVYELPTDELEPDQSCSRLGYKV